MSKIHPIGKNVCKEAMSGDKSSDDKRIWALRDIKVKNK